MEQVRNLLRPIRRGGSMDSSIFAMIAMACAYSLMILARFVFLKSTHFCWQMHINGICALLVYWIGATILKVVKSLMLSLFMMATVMRFHLFKNAEALLPIISRWMACSIRKRQLNLSKRKRTCKKRS